MIYTLTFNPALDYVIKVDDFKLGEINKVVQEDIFYGGKGLNVSAMLKNLGMESTALGFIAGFTGKVLEDGIKTLGIHTDFIQVDKGRTRINVKMKSKEESEINGMGPEIAKGHIKELFKKLKQLKDGDTLILSGSIPSMVDEAIYQIIMEQLQEKSIRIIVDATKDLLMNTLKYKPFLIKPNTLEMEEIFDVKFSSDKDVVEYAKKMQGLGAKNVLVSMAKDGAILIDELGKVHQSVAPKGIVKNSVGAGDSMVAGFVASVLRGNSYEEALKWSVAAGSASAFNDGLATKDRIQELYEQL